LLNEQPQVSQALLLLSRINQEKGSLCTSVAYALRYLLLEPDEIEAFSVVAALLMEMGEERSATRVAFGGLVIDRMDECCNVTTCMLGIVHGQYVFAGRRLHRILKEFPESGRGWLALTYKDMFVGSWRSALGSAVKATLYLPAERISWACLGWCQLLTGDLIGAAHSYSEVLNLDPQDAEARGALALIALLSDKLEEAEKWILQAQRNNPASASAQVVGLLTLLSGGNSDAAYDKFEDLARCGAKSFLEMLGLLSLEQKTLGKLVLH
jgi:tetratricopeptide (TPR) repeat protein